LALALAGVEPTHPASLLDATFPTLDVHMTYSHNLIPGFIQGLVVFAIVFATWRDRPLALWCGALTVVHVLCDLLVGFKHELLGPDSPQVSLDTYGHAPVLAIAIELAFALGCIYAFLRMEKRHGRPFTCGRATALYAAFVIGILAWLPATTMSLRQAFAQVS
jgi:membrane-bound metal-dependent hydrolase YbcI (DUF457 family)